MNLRNQILRSPQIPFAYRINYLANFFVGAVFPEMHARLNLSRSEFVVLYCLQALGELTAQDICDITGRPKNSVSRAVNAVFERGFVTRRVDKLDARRVPMKMTARGRDMLAAALPLLQAREEAMLSSLTARDRAQLDRLLAKLVLRDDVWHGDAVVE